MNATHRLTATYFAIAAAFLIAGYFAHPPLHHILLVTGVCFLGAFIPIAMAIFFVRGLRQTR